MGVEVVGSEMAPVPSETVTEVENSLLQKENGNLDNESGHNEPIKFGSHGEDPVKGDGNEGAADRTFPKDAVDEWPAPKQIHSFYFVRFRRYDDPKIQTKIEQADKEMSRCNLSRIRITDEIRTKKSERADLINQMKALRNESGQYQAILDEKKKEMQPLQQALGKLRTNNTGRGGLCSSEEELNDVIYSLQYRIQHESIPLNEEKQILREIKQLEGTREKVVANAAMRTKIQDSMGQKEAIQDQVKLIGVDLDGVRKEKDAIWVKIKGLDPKVNALNKEIESLQEELAAVTDKREKAYQSIKKLREQRDGGNALFFESRRLLTAARELAASKDLKALEELSHAEFEKFMSLWSNDKAFRDDYEKRILPSLDSRQLSRDGRMRNPDERPLLAVDVPAPSKPEPAVKANAKRPKDEVKPTTQKEAILPSQKVQKETVKAESKLPSEHVDAAKEEIIEFDNVPKKTPAEKEVDEATLKELKREEEMAKAKQAMERKKKLAEKAAAKAAIRAQKEAEKKLKEREKKLKKKAAASVPANESEELAEEVPEGVELEKVEDNDEAPVTVKERVRKDKIRHRKQPKGSDSLPRGILKKKKSTNYWIWAAPAAMLVLVLLALGYYYLL